MGTISLFITIQAYTVKGTYSWQKKRFTENLSLCYSAPCPECCSAAALNGTMSRSSSSNEFSPKIFHLSQTLSRGHNTNTFSFGLPSLSSPCRSYSRHIQSKKLSTLFFGTSSSPSMSYYCNITVPNLGLQSHKNYQWREFFADLCPSSPVLFLYFLV